MIARGVVVCSSNRSNRVMEKEEKMRWMFGEEID